MKILYVEDSAADAELARRALARLFYQALWTSLKETGQ